jgi:integrase
MDALLSPARTPRETVKAKPTAKAVETALVTKRPPTGRYRLWFESPAGFFLLIPAKGIATYYLRYKKPDGTFSEIALARETDVSVVIAAEKANRLTAQLVLQEGFDPVVDRQARIAQAKTAKLRTFEALSGAFMDAPENQDISPRTKEIRDGLLKLILPQIGAKSAQVLRRGDIRECIRAIQQGVKAKRPNVDKAGHRRANQAKSFISQIFEWASESEILEHNPARFKKMFDDRSRKRIGKMTEAKLKAFWDALVAEGEDPKFAEGRAIGIAIRLCMATLQRPNELCNTLKSDLDLTAKMLCISEDRTKTNAFYQIPLSDLACDLFREALALSNSNSKWVFPSKADDGEDSPVRPCVTDKRWQRTRARLLVAKKIPDKDVQLYDCKRWGRSKIRELGFSREVAERCISHSQPRDEISTVYDISDYLPDMRKAMAAIEGELKRITSGEGR